MTQELLEEEKPKTPILTTLCEHCVFSQWLEDTQIGCQFNKIEKYKKVGVPVNQIEEGNRKFFSINSLCTTARTVYWPKYSDNIHQMMTDVRKECQLSVDCILLCDSLDELKQSLPSIIHQTVPFKKLYIATETTSPSEWIIFAIEQIASKIDWQIISLARETLKQVVEENQHPFINVKLDAIVTYAKSQYFSIFEAGKDIPLRFVESLDIASNDYLHRFILVRPYEGINGLTCQTATCHHIGNFGQFGIIEKLEKRLEEDIADGSLTEDKRQQLITDYKTVRGYLNESNGNNSY